MCASQACCTWSKIFSLHGMLCSQMSKGKLPHGQYSRIIRQQGMVLISVFQVLSRQWACRDGRTHLFHNLSGFYTGTKLYCLVTEAHGCEQLAQSCYLRAAWLGLNSRRLDHESDAITTTPPSQVNRCKCKLASIWITMCCVCVQVILPY